MSAGTGRPRGSTGGGDEDDDAGGPVATGVVRATMMAVPREVTVWFGLDPSGDGPEPSLAPAIGTVHREGMTVPFGGRVA